MNHDEESIQIPCKKTGTIDLEQGEGQLGKEEAEKVKKLQENLAENFELRLLNLLQIKLKIQEYENALVGKRKAIENIQKTAKLAEERLIEVKKEQLKVQNYLTKADSEIRERKNAILKKLPDFVKAKEKSVCMQKRVENSKRSLKETKKSLKTQQSKVQLLKNRIISAVR